MDVDTWQVFNSAYTDWKHMKKKVKDCKGKHQNNNSFFGKTKTWQQTGEAVFKMSSLVATKRINVLRRHVAWVVWGSLDQELISIGGQVVRFSSKILCKEDPSMCNTSKPYKTLQKSSILGAEQQLVDQGKTHFLSIHRPWCTRKVASASLTLRSSRVCLDEMWRAGSKIPGTPINPRFGKEN